MSKLYRVTPKNNKWIIQNINDRSTVSDKPFIKKTDAENAMYAMIASEGNQITSTPTLLTFKQAFKKFADWKMSLYSPDGRVSEHSLKRYDQEYRLRISKYMDDQVSCKDFGITHMETYLDKLKAAGVSFKAMRKSVKDIKHFLRRANAVGQDPNLSMLTYNIYDHLGVVPQDDDLIYTREIDINILSEEKVAAIINDLYEGMKVGDLDKTNTFAIFCMLYFFGLRASELSGIKKDFHPKHSCVDMENNFLKIRGIYKEGKYINKTKNRGSKRDIEIDVDARKFLDMWLYYRMEHKPDNVWLLAGKNGGPISYTYIRDRIWKTYAKHGLAEIEYKYAGHVRVISTPLKGFPTKVFRHRFGSHMITAMNSNPLLDRNRVKNEIGHTKFSTSSDIYGNKLIRGTDKERAALAKVKAIANKSNIFSKIIEK
jgi:site-specific recombinase XerC